MKKRQFFVALSALGVIVLSPAVFILMILNSDKEFQSPSPITNFYKHSNNQLVIRNHSNSYNRSCRVALLIIDDRYRSLDKLHQSAVSNLLYGQSVNLTYFLIYTDFETYEKATKKNGFLQENTKLLLNHVLEKEYNPCRIYTEAATACHLFDDDYFDFVLSFHPALTFVRPVSLIGDLFSQFTVVEHPSFAGFKGLQSFPLEPYSSMYFRENITYFFPEIFGGRPSLIKNLCTLAMEKMDFVAPTQFHQIFNIYTHAMLQPFRIIPYDFVQISSIEESSRDPAFIFEDKDLSSRIVDPGPDQFGNEYNINFYFERQQLVRTISKVIIARLKRKKKMYTRVSFKSIVSNLKIPVFFFYSS